jgi:hypothetical protein
MTVTSFLAAIFILLFLTGSYLYYEVLDAQNAELNEQLQDLTDRIRTYKEAHNH